MGYSAGGPGILAQIFGSQLFGLTVLDLIVLLLYFASILGIGLWAMKRIRNQADYFLGGRRFGKLVQVFASFGQATSTDTAVASTTMVSTNGASGVWAGLAGGLFNLPLMWFWSMWFRRVRLTTLADIFEERYNSNAMAGFYALTQIVFLIFVAGVGIVALNKTVAAICLKPAAEYTPAEVAEHTLGVELLQLEQRDYLTLDTTEKARLNELRELNPKREFSYINQTYLTIITALVVLAYAGLGGLEGAFITDLVQGSLLLVLSVMLFPFAMVRINEQFGESGFLGPFRAMHRELPESFFELLGSPGVPEFTWYWIAAYALMGMLNIAVQANGMVGPASAKDDYTARYGFVVGLFMKRYTVVLWGFLAMMTLLLYGRTAGDPDLVWGLAAGDLLGRAGFGLIGLMLACLMAALMSTMSAHQVVVSALIARNLYLPVVRYVKRNAHVSRPAVATVDAGASSGGARDLNSSIDDPASTSEDSNAGLSERHMVWAGRIFGCVYVSGSVIVALSSSSVFDLIKFIATFNAVVAAAFWLGMLWRGSNKFGAWTSMIVTFLMILALPNLIPLIPGVRTSEYLLKRSVGAEVQRPYIAKALDVEDRNKLIADWEKLRADGLATTSRPEPMVEGQRFNKTFKNPSKSVFWAGDIKMVKALDDQGNPLRDAAGRDVLVAQGQGMLKIDLIIVDQIAQLFGTDLSRTTYATNETWLMLMRAIVPFGSLMIVSLLTRREDKTRLDRFFVKMKTRVNADPAIDAAEMAASYANPHRFDHLKLLGPSSNWEFRKWDHEDLRGVIWCIIAIAGCLLLMWLMVTIGG